jgi:mono/diheme cytochrome c family protein
MWKVGPAVVALALLVIALVVKSGGDTRPLAVDHPGYPVYRTYCRRCHGNEGDAAKASRVAGRPVDLAAPAYRDTLTFEDVRAVVLHGKKRMPAYADKLDEGEIDAVSVYVLEMAAARVRVRRE